MICQKNKKTIPNVDEVWNRFGDSFLKRGFLVIVTFCCLLVPQREMLRFNCTSAICTTPKRA
nr:MAG TPA: hypothetical protein [Caudoviricetes sp.]